MAPPPHPCCYDPPSGPGCHHHPSEGASICTPPNHSTQFRTRNRNGWQPMNLCRSSLQVWQFADIDGTSALWYDCCLIKWFRYYILLALTITHVVPQTSYNVVLKQKRIEWCSHSAHVNTGGKLGSRIVRAAALYPLLGRLHLFDRTCLFVWRGLSVWQNMFIRLTWFIRLTGMRIFVHGCAATPNLLLEAMAKFGKSAKLKNVELIHVHTEGPAIYAQEEYQGLFWSL